MYAIDFIIMFQTGLKNRDLSISCVDNGNCFSLQKAEEEMTSFTLAGSVLHAPLVLAISGDSVCNSLSTTSFPA